MEILITPAGTGRAIYGEEIPLASLGPLVITRASLVEPDAAGAWSADLTPVGGPILGPFDRRSNALRSEIAWLETHWLAAGIPAITG